MALTNPKIFGLNIKTEFADVRNKNTALLNLGLNPLDLEIIKGSSNAGMTRYDWFSFSRLKEPIYKRLSRFEGESSLFNSILNQRAGTDQTLFGNLDINGSLSGSSIRYRFLDGTNPGKLADISTSRVSAWSSSDPRANDNDLDIQKLARISYGARVSIISGGQLQFEPQSTVSNFTYNGVQYTGPAGQNRLQTSSTPEVKEFDSEVPTSKIKCNINGKEVFLYAMKGIPLTFKGFFRNLNAKVNINYTQGGSIPASWKIVETGNADRFVNFKNIGTGESSIAFRSPVSRERFIKFYYNPKYISEIQIQSANIRELPPTRLENCTTLDFAYNQLKIFPNIAFIAPKLNTLSLMRNPLYLSDNEFERKFNNLIMDKLKTTSGAGNHSSITALNMEGTFYGSIERHLISSKLPNLTSLNFARGGGANFHPDDRPDSGLTNNSGGSAFCPDVPNGVTNYNIRSNDFRSVDLAEISPNNASNAVTIVNTSASDGSLSTGTTSLPNGSYSFKKAPNLTSLDVHGNYYLGESHTSGDYNLQSGGNGKNDSLVNINFSVTALAIPNMQGSITLENFSQTYARGGTINKLVDTGGVYRFENCSKLKELSFLKTNLGSINFPVNGFTNVSLTDLDLRYTGIKGGIEGDESEVIKQSTFASCPNIQNIYIDSSNLLAEEINFDAFKLNPKLDYLYIRSYDSVKGNLPDFSGNPVLRSLYLSRNNFDGALPNFGSQSSSIYYVNVTHNSFTGQIPAFTNLSSLRTLELNNNAFTSIGEPNNLPNLWYYYAHNNQLSGEIPDFTSCTNLRYLTLYNNQLAAYKLGSFRTLYKIKYFDLSNNNLGQTAQDNIISDLYDNWSAINRGGVNINLRGNKNQNGIKETPSDEAKEKATILVANGWNVTINGGLT